LFFNTPHPPVREKLLFYHNKIAISSKLKQIKAQLNCYFFEASIRWKYWGRMRCA